MNLRINTTNLCVGLPKYTPLPDEKFWFNKIPLARPRQDIDKLLETPDRRFFVRGGFKSLQDYNAAMRAYQAEVVPAEIINRSAKEKINDFSARLKNI